jgi:hypothetical protein
VSGIAFDEAQLDDDSRWYTVDIGDALPLWGEGGTEAAALDDLADSIRSLWRDLRDEPDERLAFHLRQQRDFLKRLFGAEDAT